MIFPQEDSVLFLTGRVAIEQDLPIPKEFRVELVCSNRVIQQSYPSKSGTFSFDLGSAKLPATVMDASGSPTRGGLEEGFTRSVWDDGGFLVIRGRVYLDDCVVRAAPLAGYTSNAIALGVRDLQDNPDIGVIEIRKVTGSDGAAGTVRATTAAAPMEAVKAFEKARKELTKKKVDHSEVQEQLENAVEVYPQFAEAWCILGETRMILGDPKGAREAFELSIASDPKLIHSYAGLAQLDIEQKKWMQAAHRTRQIKEMDPSYPRGLLFDGLANYYLRHFDAARKSLEELETLGHASTFPIAYLHLGMIYADKGEITAAANALRAYLSAGQAPAERRQKIETQLEIWEDQGLIEAQ